MVDIKIRIWNPHGKRMLYDIENVFDCLKQQIAFNGTQESRGFTPKFDHYSEGMRWLRFTGLKDNEGEDIYEGDILHSNVNRRWFNWLVKIIDGHTCLINIGVDGYLHEPMFLDKNSASQRCIIGNEFETPELLKL